MPFAADALAAVNLALVVLFGVGAVCLGHRLQPPHLGEEARLGA